MEVRKKDGGEKKKRKLNPEARYPGSWRFNQGVPFVSDILNTVREGGGGGAGR